MNTREFKNGIKNLWYLASVASHYNYAPYPDQFSLGCTPLNEAIVASLDIIPNFQRASGVQIVNMIVLSDGEGHRLMSGYRYGNERHYLRDSKSRKTYEINSTGGRGGDTDALLALVKDRTDANMIGIYLLPQKSIAKYQYSLDPNNHDYNAWNKKVDQWKKENFISVDRDGYDGYFVVKADTSIQTDALDNLDGDASFTKIKNAFMKGSNSKKSSRVIAGRIVDIIAA
jgi:hypothetical protein